jgi:hypothetical protein
VAPGRGPDADPGAAGGRRAGGTSEAAEERAEGCSGGEREPRIERDRGRTDDERQREREAFREREAAEGARAAEEEIKRPPRAATAGVLPAFAEPFVMS